VPTKSQNQCGAVSWMITGTQRIVPFCDQPLDLAVERYSENGKPIHEMCYIKRLSGDIIPDAPNGSAPQAPLM
jgi:hypothetical protein